MPDPKPHHRRAAADAVRFIVPVASQSRFQQWIENGDIAHLGWSSGKNATDVDRTAQAIAEAEERGRQEIPSPERLNRIQIPLPECEVTGRNLKHLMLTNGGALLYHTLADSESAALAHVLNGTRFRPTLLLEPVQTRAAPESKP